MKFRILGPLSVTGPSGCLDVVAPRQSIVLTMLLAECRRVVSMERLVEAVWDESPPQTAIGQVQICVSALRRALAKVGLPGLLQTHPAGYRLMADPDEVDMMVFQRLVGDARCLSGEGKLDEAASAYKQALDLWRGETLGAADSILLRAAGTRLDEIRGRAIEEHIE